MAEVRSSKEETLRYNAALRTLALDDGACGGCEARLLGSTSSKLSFNSRHAKVSQKPNRQFVDNGVLGCQLSC